MKKSFLFILLVLSLLLVGCRIPVEKTETPIPEQTPVEVTPTPVTPTPTPTPEVTLDSIYVKNAQDKYYVDLGKQFDVSHLVVMAKYSDETEVDVTKDVLYSTINTAQKGEKELVITYEDVNTSIKVDVIKTVGIDVNTTEVKMLYKKGEKFDLSGLVVYNIYEDNLKLASSTYNITLLDSKNDIISISNELKVGTYTVLISNNGYNFKYSIEAIDGELEDNKKITFEYSLDGFNSFKANVYTNYPEQYAIVPEGYAFLGYSKAFNEWENGDTVTIHIEPKQQNKHYIAFMDEGYLYNTYKAYDANSVINRKDLEAVPTIIPNASQLSHWDLPFTFILEDDLYVTPIFCPSNINLSAFNVTDEATINNVSANAIDVNVDEFLASTPEGYSLRSITLGINGEVVKEIPYTDGMISAYFTELTNNTNYEVGAYYSQNQVSEASLRKSKQLTYDFHFVGFMIMTSGDIMYRVRMMYDGDCLYRWYFGPKTIVFTHNFFFSFALPNEYKNYEVAGSFDELGYLDQDKDCNVILVPPASSTCTVVFYDRTYPTYVNILDLEIVNKGASATPPQVEQYYFNYSGTYKYNFKGWSKSYTNVKTNVFTRPEYTEEALIPPTAEMTAHVGDDYLIAYVDMDDYSTVSSTSLYLTRKSNGSKTTIASATYINNTRYFKEGCLTPGQEYSLTLEYKYKLNDGNGVQTKKLVYDFTAMATDATLGYQMYPGVSDFDSFDVFCDGEISGMIARPVGNSKASYLFSSSGYFYGTCQNTTYIVNYYKRSAENKDLYYIYSDEVTCHTSVPQMFEIYDLKYKVTTKLELFIDYIDTDHIMNCILVYIDSPELTGYSAVIRYFPMEPHQSIGLSKYFTTSFEVKDPETGELTYYDVKVEKIVIQYYLDGEIQQLVFGNIGPVDNNGFIDLV